MYFHNTFQIFNQAMSNEAKRQFPNSYSFPFLPRAYLWRWKGDEAHLFQYRRERSVIPRWAMKHSSTILHREENLKEKFVSLTGSANANFKSTTFTVYKTLLHSEKEMFTTLTPKMTGIDIKSLVSYSTAVFIPGSKGIIFLFGMERTGSLWFSNAWIQPKILNSLFKAGRFGNIRFSAVGVYMGQRWNWYNSVIKIFWVTRHLAACYLWHSIIGFNVFKACLVGSPGLLYLGLIPGNNGHTFS